MADFYQFKNRTIITATLVMETPISVGSRLSLLPVGSDLPVIKTPQGIPFIPGSSLKGVVRAHTERLLRTFEAMKKTIKGERLWACDPLSERERCVIASCCKNCEDCKGNCCSDCQRCKSCMVRRSQKEGFLKDSELTQEIWSQSCTACRLFGSQWFASRISFQDAMLSNGEELLRLTEVRDGVGIDRDLGSAKPKIKYDYEVVPAGAHFGVCIIVENAEDWEVGLLLFVLKGMERGEIAVGGKTSRGLGWGKLRGLEVRRIDKDSFRDYLQSGNWEVSETSKFEKELVKALKGGE